MKEVISIAVLIATLFGGTMAAEKIYCSVREATLTKASQGLPSLSRFGHALTSPVAVHGSQAQAQRRPPAK